MNTSLRLTPRASPGPRTPANRSPIKPIREEPECLSLHKVVGCTVFSSNAVCHVERMGLVAYTAGTTAIVAQVSSDYVLTQRIFQARPYSSTSGANPTYFDSPLSTPLTKQSRGRASILPRDLVNLPSASNAALGSPLHSYGARTGAQQAKSKTITCVSLSQDGKWLAVGDAGYKPRVHVFTLGRETTSGDSLMCTFAEHSFGVKSVAFSPDSRYLASLGDINDGFLCIWSINQRTGDATLHSSNKCTSNVRSMTWVGNNLVTVGTRHVKMWCVERASQASPSKKFDACVTVASPLKTLSGRNCILGPLLDKTYSAVGPIDDNKAFLCSDEGDICVLEDLDTTPSIRKVGCVDDPIASACISLRTLVVNGPSGLLQAIPINQLLKTGDSTETTSPTRDLRTDLPFAPTHVGLVPIRDCLLTFSSDDNIRVLSLNEDTADHRVRKLQDHFAGHGSAVRGVQKASLNQHPQSSFLTFAADGKVIFWNWDAKPIVEVTIHLDSEGKRLGGQTNELKAAVSSATSGCVYTGDALGFLTATVVDDSQVLFETKAHADEITCIDVHEAETETLVASSSRDRTIQVFQQRQSSTELLQTLEDHIGAVTCVAFSKEAEKLVSCSTDRSVLVRAAVRGGVAGTPTIAYIAQRTIALKATPLSLHVFRPDEFDCVLVSAMDKSVTRYHLQDNEIVETFKASDDDDGDLVSLNCVVPLSWSRNRGMIAGVANSDKSVRLYTDSGNILSRDYGHGEGLTGVVAIHNPSLPSQCRLCTVAHDGTMFLWDVQRPCEPEASPDDSLGVSQGTPKTGALSAVRPPLRKVLSSSELARLQSNLPNPPIALGTPRARSPSPKKASTNTIASDTAGVKTSTSSRRVKNASEPANAPSSQKTITAPPKPGSPPPSPSRSSQARPVPKRVRRQSSQPVLSSVERQASRGQDDPLTLSTAMASLHLAGDLQSSTQSICRLLHGYRRRLGSSEEPLAVEQVRELEKELSQTAKVLAEKAARNEAILEKLLDRYGERLVELMERRIDEKVDKLVEQGALLGKPDDAEKSSSL